MTHLEKSQRFHQLETFCSEFWQKSWHQKNKYEPLHLTARLISAPVSSLLVPATPLETRRTMQTVVTATRPTTHSVIRLAMPPPPAKSPRATGRGVKNSSRWQYQPLAGVRRAHLSLSAVDAILGDWRPPVSASDDEQACKKRKRCVSARHDTTCVMSLSP